MAKRNCTNMAARAGAGIFASLALAAAGAVAPSALGGGCGTISGTSAGQIGIQGGFLQECGDDQWTGLAFAINTGGGSVDTLTFQLNTNRAGGDVYITGDAGGCQPDVTNILATMCCSLEGLPTGETLTLHFTPVDTSADSPTWVVFVGRTGEAGQDEDGNFDGSTFPPHQVARECTDDGNDGCVEPSLPGQGFANLVGTGAPGDWTDLDDFGLGTNYTVALSFTAADADVFNCADFVGSCCLLDGSCVEPSHDFQCFPGEGSTYAGDGVNCMAANCTPLCPFTDPKFPGGDPCGQPDAGPCAFANGSPGCDDPVCCCDVCAEIPECCFMEWTAICADKAIELDCAPEPGIPADLATGPDETVDGYLRIGSDDFGSYSDPGFGGGLGDSFNPVGAEGPGAPTFAAGFSVYRQAFGEGELLSTNTAYQNVCGDDGSMTRAVTTLSVSTDTNDDGVDDTKVSTWDLTSVSGMDTSWVLTQHVFNDTPKGGPLVAIVTFDFEITNNSGVPVDFILHRHLDIDSLYVTNSFEDDNVGTGTNGSALDRFVYQGDIGHPETHITLSSPSGDVYYGGKNGGPTQFPKDPDCDAYVAGTDDQVCMNLGTPDCWKNYIVNVGLNANGDSDTMPGGDGFIGMEFPVSLAAEGVTTVSVMLTYGAKTPGGVPDAGGPPCPADLDGPAGVPGAPVPDGVVGVHDLLFLIGVWGDCPPKGGCPADLDGPDGVPGAPVPDGVVGVHDLLFLIGVWGDCPA